MSMFNTAKLSLESYLEDCELERRSEECETRKKIELTLLLYPKANQSPLDAAFSNDVIAWGERYMHIYNVRRILMNYTQQLWDGAMPEHFRII